VMVSGPTLRFFGRKLRNGLFANSPKVIALL